MRRKNRVREFKKKTKEKPKNETTNKFQGSAWDLASCAQKAPKPIPINTCPIRHTYTQCNMNENRF